MSKKKKVTTEVKNVDNNINVNEVVIKDKSNIEDATQTAIQTLDSVAYADNLAKPNTSSKSIHSLDIKENETSEDNTEISHEESNNTEEMNFPTQDLSIKSNTKHSSNKVVLISCISIGFVVILLLILSTVFAFINANKKTIISGVYVKGINISGLTKEEATSKISEIFNNQLSKEIVLKHNDFQTSIFPEQLNVSFDIESSVDMAYKKGRSGNIFKNNFDILSSLFYNTNINPSFTYNEETLNSLITQMQDSFTDKLVEPSYYIDGNNLIITKGIDGVVILSDSFKSNILYYINNLNCSVEYIDIPVDGKIASTIDIDKIYSEVHRDAQDAYYTKDPYVVHPHVDGIDFDMTIDEAKALLLESKESYTIPLKVLSPNITTNQIGTEAFPDLLGNFSTTYSTRNTNRSTNIRLAASKINGTVIMPGETFSYNQTVGQRTAAAGFKSAAVYSNGEVTTGIGGGICQVSSTLYNCVLLANLDIVERYNHGFNTGYVPAGRDATVSWGGPDFKFKNTRNYPVKIVSSGSGGTISIKIFGLKSDNEYDVEIQSYITKYISYKTINKQDSSLAKGTTKVIQNGSNGCKSVCYRILKQNGEVISKTLLSSDTYNPHNKIVAIGTK